MRILKMLTMTFLSVITFSSIVMANDFEDKRQLIDIPYEIKEKMLVNMRDHIVALDEMLAAVVSDEFETAVDIAETRLGWSSLLHNDDQLVANHWSVPMQKMADEMYRASSNFVIEAQNASVERDKTRYRKVMSALHKVTTTCKNCHSTYRIQ